MINERGMKAWIWILIVVILVSVGIYFLLSGDSSVGGGLGGVGGGVPSPPALPE